MPQMAKVVAIVGMSGSGKSEVTKVLEEAGFRRVRFGDLTDREVQQRGLALTEENERRVREELRREHGMAAYAKLNLPVIEDFLKRFDVVIDGLYSWEEYKVLKEHFGESLSVWAVYSSPRKRQERLSCRKVRPLTRDESISRDYAEIEHLDKGGPIAMADFTLVNESTLDELRRDTQHLIGEFL